MAEDVKEVEELEVAESTEVVETETEVVEEVAESTEETAEEVVEEPEAIEEVAEVEEVKEELSAVNHVEAFQALADEYGYEFAKANYEKSEVDILKAVIAQKDEELSKKADGIEAVEFSDGEAKPKLSLKQAIEQKKKK